MSHEPTNAEILDAVNTLSHSVDERFDRSKTEVMEAVNALAHSFDGKFGLIDQQFKEIDQRFEQRTTEILEAMNDFAHSVDGRFALMDQRFDRIEGTMVTKDYLDDKLGDLRGDLVFLLRKEDEKLDTLVDTLHETKIITDSAAVRIAALGPFAQK